MGFDTYMTINVGFGSLIEDEHQLNLVFLTSVTSSSLAFCCCARIVLYCYVIICAMGRHTPASMNLYASSNMEPKYSVRQD